MMFFHVQREKTYQIKRYAIVLDNNKIIQGYKWKLSS